ncbi:manganese efflux pump [Anaerolentibacter hominis]|uniref:manganese efflux pump n=1 Tax=Anaerolentibacter hominis TaxID=3079009 RepID=UPI0031B8628D
MLLLQMVLFSFSVSIDAFGIGMSYGVRGIRVPLPEKLAIGLVSWGVMWAALKTGLFLTGTLSGQIVKGLGSLVLVGMGIYYICSGIWNKGKECDLDNSMVIDLKEACLMGALLSLDSGSLGVAAAAIGVYHWILPVMVGVFQTLVFSLGTVMAGHRLLKKKKINSGGILSGVLLISIALFRFFAS